MQCHRVDYTIIGDDMQTVEIGLDPGETIIAEAGAMNYMNDAIKFEAKMGDGSPAGDGLIGKLVGAGKRMLSGESLFMTHFTNTSDGRRSVAFSAPYPGKIIALDLAAHNNEIFCQKDAFLCAAFGTRVEISFTRRLGTGFFGGEGFILQKLTGDGMAFVHAGGTVIKRYLNNETLRIDTGCVVAFESNIDFDILPSGSLKSMVFGGEGIFLASLRGTGQVWLQSMPLRKLIQAISPYGRNIRKGSSSILGDFLER